MASKNSGLGNTFLYGVFPRKPDQEVGKAEVYKPVDKKDIQEFIKKMQQKWSTNINELAKQIVEWRISKGFHTPTSIDTEAQRDLMLGKLMLVVSEVSEAAEAVRHHDMPNLKEELADAIIRLLDISHTLGIDIHKEIHDKMDKNAERPNKHGKKTSL